jgi:cysteine desulfurase family protein (TIGR01976 family)
MSTTPRVPAALDLPAIRAAFPALARRVGEAPVAYFDGPGGTQVPQVVVDAMADYLVHHNANTHWVYPSSRETDLAIAEARSALAEFLGARPEEVAFGANMTTLTFHLARALGRNWKPGDEVVVTELDHHANLAPWQAVARERGITLRPVPFDPSTGELVWSALEAALTPRTRLVAIGAASNALGTITDVARAARLAHEVGALCFVDAVHYAAHAAVDVVRLGCDFLACSSYKFYGPHLGILFGRHALLATLDVPKLEPAPETAPERVETGTQNHEGIVGARAAVEFIGSLGRGDSRRRRLADAARGLQVHGQSLVDRLWRGLGDIPGVTRYGPPPDRPRTPTVSFNVAGRSAEAVALALAARGVFVSHGDFYAATVMRRLGLEAGGAVRAGCACYTSEAEVDRLLEGVETAASTPR